MGMGAPKQELLIHRIRTRIAPAVAMGVGATAGAGTGLVVAGPVGAVAGGVVGAVFGEPFWGPPIGHGACWIDGYFRRHCAWHYRYRR